MIAHRSTVAHAAAYCWQSHFAFACSVVQHTNRKKKSNLQWSITRYANQQHDVYDDNRHWRGARNSTSITSLLNALDDANQFQFWPIEWLEWVCKTTSKKKTKVLSCDSTATATKADRKVVNWKLKCWRDARAPQPVRYYVISYFHQSLKYYRFYSVEVWSWFHFQNTPLTLVSVRARLLGSQSE